MNGRYRLLNSPHSTLCSTVGKYSSAFAVSPLPPPLVTPDINTSTYGRGSLFTKAYIHAKASLSSPYTHLMTYFETPPCHIVLATQVPVAQVAGDVLAASPDKSAGSSQDGWTSKVELPTGATPAVQCPPCDSCEPCPSTAATAAIAGATLAAPESGDTCAEVMGRCRKQSLEQTTPHIIECSEAGEGGSQEVRRLFRGGERGGARGVR